MQSFWTIFLFSFPPIAGGIAALAKPAPVVSAIGRFNGWLSARQALDAGKDDGFHKFLVAPVVGALLRVAEIESESRRCGVQVAFYSYLVAVFVYFVAETAYWIAMAAMMAAFVVLVGWATIKVLKLCERLEFFDGGGAQYGKDKTPEK